MRRQLTKQTGQESWNLCLNRSPQNSHTTRGRSWTLVYWNRPCSSNKLTNQPEYPVMVTSTSLSPPEDQRKGTASGYLFPEGKYFTDIPIQQADSFMKAWLLPEEKIDKEKKDLFKSRDMDHALILVCGHAARDARCGQIAPLLVNEFKAVLEEHGLLYYQGVSDPQNKFEVGICSHIGGHVVSTCVQEFMVPPVR